MIMKSFAFCLHRHSKPSTCYEIVKNTLIPVLKGLFWCLLNVAVLVKRCIEYFELDYLCTHQYCIALLGRKGSESVYVTGG